MNTEEVLNSIFAKVDDSTAHAITAGLLQPGTAMAVLSELAHHADRMSGVQLVATRTEAAALALGKPRPLTMTERQVADGLGDSVAIAQVLKRHQAIIVEHSRVPKGCKLVEAYQTAREYVVMGEIDPEDETHSCDEMMCGCTGHVVARIPIDQAKEQK